MINQSQWTDFLANFSRRNHARRARFERFDREGVQEEEQEAHLENLTLKFEGADAPQLIVTRRDQSTTEPQTIVTTITNVKRLNTHFDTYHSEDGLEIEDENGVLLLLRMESLVDGVS
ncbi:MAG: hypothetical protein U0Y68_08315 [Blastocatellia bacterium]